MTTAAGIRGGRVRRCAPCFHGVSFLACAARLGAVLAVCRTAVHIRLHAVTTYGRVIHEFDPWFNFRATQYLSENGWHAFSTWYDYKSWYPLGRPVGTTIYPGMQIAAVLLHEGMQKLGYTISLNDVCVLMPAGFGVLTSLFTGAFTAEVTGSTNSGIIAAGIMAIIPAHLMRSVAGGYDNESVAVCAIACTFFCWCRSLRTEHSWKVFGVLTGLSYTYMVAAWGGYIFVLNMIGVHAAVLCIVGRYSQHLHHSYSLFFIVGTAGALQIPVVGLQPLQSLEQLGRLHITPASSMSALCSHCCDM